MSWGDVLHRVERERASVLAHPLYSALDSLDALRTFTEHHCWAVWDFMSLLTQLQRVTTCVTVPWVPSRYDAAIQRFVNEIKLGEESDPHPDGGWTSHFDLYLGAMVELDADTTAVAGAVGELSRNPLARPSRVAERHGAPPGAVEFVRTTFSLTALEPVAVAAAFALGREQLIPDLFRPLLDRYDGRLLQLYLQRHVELDEGEHGPLARQLVVQLAEATPDGWAIAEAAALRSIEARRRLWDATLAAIRTPRPLAV